MVWLKKDTAATIALGPFLSSTDGVTPSTALTPTINLCKAGSTGFAARGSVVAITAEAGGWYMVPLSTADLGTAGMLTVQYASTGNILPVWAEFLVVPGAVYDALVAGSSYLPVDVQTWLGNAVAVGVSNYPAVDAVGIGSSTATPVTLQTNIGNLDAAVSGRTATTDWTVARSAKIDNLDALISSRTATTDWTVARSAKVDNLDALITSRVATTDLTVARSAKLDNLDALVSSRTATTDWTVARAAKIDYLDATVSSRASGADYTALRAAKLDSVDVLLSSRAATTDWTVARAAKIDYLDAAITSRLASTAYTAPDNAGIAAIQAATTTLPASPAATSDCVTAASVWSGITAAAANMVADHVLRRTQANVEASTDGDALSFRSLYGAAAKLVNKISATTATLTIYKSDDSSALGTQTITADSAASPITALDTA